MKVSLTYNFLSQVIPQMPDSKGNFKYYSYHKYDLIIKNGSVIPIQNQTIIINFNKGVLITKIIVSDLNIKPLLLENNKVKISIINFKKKQSYNFDFFVANCNLNDNIECIPELSGVEIKRSKKLTVKKLTVKKRKLFKSFSLKRFLYDPYTVRIFGGLAVIIIVTIAPFRCSKSNIDSINKPLKLNSLDTNKNRISNEIKDSSLKRIDTSTSNVHIKDSTIK